MAGGSEAGRRAFLRRVALFASLSDDEKADILGRTAARLFNVETQTVGTGTGKQ